LQGGALDCFCLLELWDRRGLGDAVSAGGRGWFWIASLALRALAMTGARSRGGVVMQRAANALAPTSKKFFAAVAGDFFSSKKNCLPCLNAFDPGAAIR
jgi:hypothetical protein